MMTRAFILMVTSAALLGFAPAPFPRAPRTPADDLTNADGAWEFVRYEYRKMRTPGLEQSHRVELSKGKFALVEKVGKGGVQSVWEMRLNPATSPPSFTWTMGGRLTHVGSYRLDGDRLTMVFATHDGLGIRPTDLGTSPADGWRFVLRRVKRH